MRSVYLLFRGQIYGQASIMEISCIYWSSAIHLLSLCYLSAFWISKCILETEDRPFADLRNPQKKVPPSSRHLLSILKSIIHYHHLGWSIYTIVSFPFSYTIKVSPFQSFQDIFDIFLPFLASRLLISQISLRRSKIHSPIRTRHFSILGTLSKLFFKRSWISPTISIDILISFSRYDRASFRSSICSCSLSAFPPMGSTSSWNLSFFPYHLTWVSIDLLSCIP